MGNVALSSKDSVTNDADKSSIICNLIITQYDALRVISQKSRVNSRENLFGDGGEKMTM